MAAKKRSFTFDEETPYYIEGNAVRQLSPVPDRRNEEYQDVREKERTTVANKTAKKEIGINFKSLLVLTMAIVATLYVCVEYLKIHSDVLTMEKSIITLENELKALTKENNNELELIYKEHDLAYVYEVAVGELGMVYPNNNTMITFEKGEKDFVRQYKDIPESIDESLLDRLLGRN